jgi:hypothetical protein
VKYSVDINDIGQHGEITPRFSVTDSLDAVLMVLRNVLDNADADDAFDLTIIKDES